MRRNRSNELIVALLAVFALAFALIFALLLSLISRTPPPPTIPVIPSIDITLTPSPPPSGAVARHQPAHHDGCC